MFFIIPLIFVAVNAQTATVLNPYVLAVLVLAVN